jgi:hypothetical protein
MTPAAFRKLALALAGASEGTHGGHPDFRSGGKVFATMGYPDKSWAMVKLTPDQQEMLCAAEPAMFRPVKGGWGLRGATNLSLAAADARTARSALAMALKNVTGMKAVSKRPAASARAAKPGGRG